MVAKKIYRTLLAASVILMAGCEAEHNKFVKESRDSWDKTRLDMLMQVADQEFKVGDYDKCRETLKPALETDKPYEPGHLLDARVELEGGSLEVAAEELKKAIAIKPDDPEPYYLMGVVYQRWQKMDKAAEYYGIAATKKPTDAVYVVAQVEMLMALNQLDQAKDILEAKIDFFEQSAAMRIALARIATLQHDPETAAKNLREASLLQPEDKQIRWSYAQALYDAGKFGDAVRILENLRKDPIELPKAPDALTKGVDPKIDEQAAKENKIEVLMMLGESYLHLNRPIDARGCFQQVIHDDPENVDVYLSLSKACLMSGSPEDLSLALASAKRVLRNNSQNVQALILQAAIQQKQRKWNEASDTLTNAARFSPKDVTVLCMEALSEMETNKKEMAIAHLEKAVAIDPSDAWANQLLAQLKPPAPPVKKIEETPAPQNGAAAPLSDPAQTPDDASAFDPNAEKAGALEQAAAQVDADTQVASADASGTSDNTPASPAQASPSPESGTNSTPADQAPAQGQ